MKLSQRDKLRILVHPHGCHAEKRALATYKCILTPKQSRYRKVAPSTCVTEALGNSVPDGHETGDIRVFDGFEAGIDRLKAEVNQISEAN